MPVKKFVEFKEPHEYYQTLFAISNAKSVLVALNKVKPDLYEAVTSYDDVISQLTEALNRIENGHCFTFDNPQLHYYREL